MLIPITSNGLSIVKSEEVLAIIQSPKKDKPQEVATLVFIKGASIPLQTDLDPIALGNFINEANGTPLKFEILNMAASIKPQAPKQ